jgi:hypothetical protein
VNIGDTLIWCPPGHPKEHLWIIISDPGSHSGKCVIINLTESSHGQHSFILRSKDHRYITKESDVNFGDAFSTDLLHLCGQIAISAAIQHDPMNMAIVNEIIKRARTHPAFSPILRRLLPPV